MIIIVIIIQRSLKTNNDNDTNDNATNDNKQYHYYCYYHYYYYYYQYYQYYHYQYYYYYYYIGGARLAPRGLGGRAGPAEGPPAERRPATIIIIISSSSSIVIISCYTILCYILYTTLQYSTILYYSKFPKGVSFPPLVLARSEPNVSLICRVGCFITQLYYYVILQGCISSYIVYNNVLLLYTSGVYIFRGVYILDDCVSSQTQNTI